MPMSRPARFGEVRLLPHRSLAERILYRVMGVVDPAHWLHFRYFQQALGDWKTLMPAHILDAGCGRGDYTLYLARRYPGAHVVGIDVDAERIARNQANATALGLRNVSFLVGDLVTVRFDQAFDLIVSIDVLEHVVEQEQAIRNLSRHLAPDGKFFFHIPTIRERPVVFSNHLASFHAWAAEEHLARDRRAEEFATIVEEAGFLVEEMRRTFGRYTGELAVSLFALPHRPTALNQALQAILAPLCRIVALADQWQLDRPRYAVALRGSRRRLTGLRVLSSDG